MLNQVVIVGRLVKEPKLKETKDKKETIITVAVPRSYKNEDGEYETDIIPCILYNVIAQNTVEYCNKGDLIGIKGRLENINNKIILVAEKITFLSSKSE